jgi:hypothetical protein
MKIKNNNKEIRHPYAICQLHLDPKSNKPTVKTNKKCAGGQPRASTMRGRCVTLSNTYKEEFLKAR